MTRDHVCKNALETDNYKVAQILYCNIENIPFPVAILGCDLAFISCGTGRRPLAGFPLAGLSPGDDGVKFSFSFSGRTIALGLERSLSNATEDAWLDDRPGATLCEVKRCLGNRSAYYIE